MLHLVCALAARCVLAEAGKCQFPTCLRITVGFVRSAHHPEKLIGGGSSGGRHGAGWTAQYASQLFLLGHRPSTHNRADLVRASRVGGHDFGGLPVQAPPRCRVASGSALVGLTSDWCSGQSRGQWAKTFRVVIEIPNEPSPSPHS